MKNLYRVPIVCLILFSIAFVIACPKKDAVREAAKASYRLPGSTNDLIDRIREGVTKGIFTPAEARKAGEILERAADLEILFVQAVKTAERIYRTTGQIPTLEFQAINSKYDEIIDAFLDLLEFVRVLSPDDRAFIDAAVAGVRLFLRTIGVGFKFASVNKLTAIADPTPRKPKTKKGISSITTTAALSAARRGFYYGPQVRFA